MPYEIGKQKLIDFLEQIDKVLSSKIKLIAVGGTAMTLLGLKSSTLDIDFCLTSNQNRKIFAKTSSELPHGYRIDLYESGAIFSQQLPEDYETKAIPISTKFKNLELFALSPLDIIVTKIGRLNERDWEDIKSCIKHAKLTKQQIKQRAKQVTYAGNDELYEYNLTDVLNKCFN